MKQSEIPQQVIKIVQKKGVLRTRDLDEYGIPRIYLTRLCHAGLLKRVGRGLYRAADSEPTTQSALAEVSKRIPNAVVCLISALQFHEFTTQLPFEIWMAVDRKAWLPRVNDLPVRFVRFSGSALKEGFNVHPIDGVEVKIYNPGKTIADCFKYRNKIGIDVAIEALRDGLTQKKCTRDEIWHYAKICRVTNVMLPYLEATA